MFKRGPKASNAADATDASTLDRVARAVSTARDAWAARRGASASASVRRVAPGSLARRGGAREGETLSQICAPRGRDVVVPEECAFLVETERLALFLSDSDEEPASVRAVYALLTRCGVSREEYLVYGYLCRLGFGVDGPGAGVDGGRARGRGDVERGRGWVGKVGAESGEGWGWGDDEKETRGGAGDVSRGRRDVSRVVAVDAAIRDTRGSDRRYTTPSRRTRRARPRRWNTTRPRCGSRRRFRCISRIEVSVKSHQIRELFRSRALRNRPTDERCGVYWIKRAGNRCAW